MGVPRYIARLHPPATDRDALPALALPASSALSPSPKLAAYAAQRPFSLSAGGLVIPLLIASLSASLNLAATPAPAATAVSLSAESQPFSETWLRDRAQQMAQADYAPLTHKLPPALKSEEH